MNERYIRWWTPHLSRDFEMLVFGDGGGTPLILFPTSFGRYSQNKDFGLTDSIASFVDSGKITIYCPGRVTGGDGTGTHASPRMHWRRGHNRTLTKGRDMPLVVPIAPMWINADEESEKTIPLRSYRLKAWAAAASPAERGRKRA